MVDKKEKNRKMNLTIDFCSVWYKHGWMDGWMDITNDTISD